VVSSKINAVKIIPGISSAIPPQPGTILAHCPTLERVLNYQGTAFNQYWLNRARFTGHVKLWSYSGCWL